MTDIGVGLGAGFGLGCVFFGGLWLTLRGVERSRHPALVVVGSFLLRLGAVGAGLWWVARAGGGAVAGALVGILAARELLRRGLARERAPAAGGDRPGAGAARGSPGPGGG